MHLTMVIVMAWITDLEEQLVIAGVRTYSCPVCFTSHHNLDHWHGTVNHAPCTAEKTITETCQVHDLYPEASTYEFKKEMKKHESRLSGAVKEFCWEGLPIGPEVFLTQDLLHRCYKFVWDHVAEWLTHIVGEEELDHCFQVQPKLGFWNFADGISKISQTSRCDHRTFLKFIVAVIAGHENVDHSVLNAIRSLIDFIYLAHYLLILESDLETMAASLDEFHKHKNVFIQNGS